MSSLTSSQQLALAVTPKVTGLLSALGSLWIVIEVATQKTKRGNVYNRIVFAMSFFDVFTSMFMFASTWPIPEDTEGVVFASGNQRSCTAQGFFLQLGLISPYCKLFRYRQRMHCSHRDDLTLLAPIPAESRQLFLGALLYVCGQIPRT